MVRIVRNFLALARQDPLERQPVRLNQIVHEAVELLGYPLRVDNVEVRLDLADDLPKLWADPHQLHQVIVNLITNAHHAMHGSTSERRLTIRTRFWAADVRVVVEVAGLGLPLCQGIVEGHGGTLRVESKVGEGTVMIIDLPVLAPPAGEVKETEAALALPPGIRVPVVDDEPHVAGVLTDLPRAQGAHVEAASGGREALERLERAEYDIILSDVRMPGLDGPALYKVLGATHPQLLSRFVFLTGDTVNPESSEFVQAPVTSSTSSCATLSPDRGER